ncbi:unnamed protein product [Amoebophrya sp. A120]|nr:unnamed protein product [Amoebophrya sp. A120]|eukprot:GSA120T00009413001.1
MIGEWLYRAESPAPGPESNFKSPQNKMQGAAQRVSSVFLASLVIVFFATAKIFTTWTPNVVEARLVQKEEQRSFGAVVVDTDSFSLQADSSGLVAAEAGGRAGTDLERDPPPRGHWMHQLLQHDDKRLTGPLSLLQEDQSRTDVISGGGSSVIRFRSGKEEATDARVSGRSKDVSRTTSRLLQREDKNQSGIMKKEEVAGSQKIEDGSRGSNENTELQSHQILVTSSQGQMLSSFSHQAKNLPDTCHAIMEKDKDKCEAAGTDYQACTGPELMADCEWGNEMPVWEHCRNAFSVALSGGLHEACHSHCKEFFQKCYIREEDEVVHLDHFYTAWVTRNDTDPLLRCRSSSSDCVRAREQWGDHCLQKDPDFTGSPALEERSRDLIAATGVYCGPSPESEKSSFTNIVEEAHTASMQCQVFSLYEESNQMTLCEHHCKHALTSCAGIADSYDELLPAVPDRFCSQGTQACFCKMRAWKHAGCAAGTRMHDAMLMNEQALRNGKDEHGQACADVFNRTASCAASGGSSKTSSSAAVQVQLQLEPQRTAAAPVSVLLKNSGDIITGEHQEQGIVGHKDLETDSESKQIHLTEADTEARAESAADHTTTTSTNATTSTATTTLLTCPPGTYFNATKGPHGGCDVYVCSCAHGTPNSGIKCVAANTEMCIECDPEYELVDGRCEFEDLSSFAAGASASSSSSSFIVSSSHNKAPPEEVACPEGQHSLGGGVCALNVCVCENGFPMMGADCAEDALHICYSCEPGYEKSAELRCEKQIGNNSTISTASVLQLLSLVNSSSKDDDDINAGTPSGVTDSSVTNQKMITRRREDLKTATEAAVEADAEGADSSKAEVDEPTTSTTTTTTTTTTETCPPGYTAELNATSEENVCHQNVCTCAHGMGQIGAQCLNNGTEVCAYCNADYELDDDTETCVPKEPAEPSEGSSSGGTSTSTSTSALSSASISSASSAAASVLGQQLTDGNQANKAQNVESSSTTAARASSTDVSCPAGQHADPGSSACVANVCSCDFGTPATGTACVGDGLEVCTHCDTGYHFHQKKHVTTVAVHVCRLNVCTCENGTGALGEACDIHHEEICATCGNGFLMTDDHYCEIADTSVNASTADAALVQTRLREKEK